LNEAGEGPVSSQSLQVLQKKSRMTGAGDQGDIAALAIDECF
jgi:hypothetical protein